MSDQADLAARAAQTCKDALAGFATAELQRDLGDKSRDWWIKIFRDHQGDLASLIERYLLKAYEEASGCLTLGRSRYQAHWQGKREYVYRLVAHGVAGIVPTKRDVVRHLCNNPRCIHPEHLRIGTQEQNMRDLRWVRAGPYGGINDEDYTAPVFEPQPAKLRPLPFETRVKPPSPKARPWKSNKP